MKTTADQQVTSRAPDTRGEMLVDRRWLSAHLDDPLVRVVEVDVAPAAYNEGHIDGAVLWNIYADVKDADYRSVGTEAFQQLVTRSGIGPHSTVVFYGYAPALGVWLLRYFGHRDARILDCSRDTWRADGLAWTTTASRPRPGMFRLSAGDPGVRADQAAVQGGIAQPGTSLVDVRSAAEYRGECFWPSGAMEAGGRAGHIPSAVHQPLDGLYRPDGAFHPAEQLREVFSASVLDGGDDLITYCTIGGRAATAWFVLTFLLGRDRVRVYDGSWAEWGRTPGTPVVCP